MQTTQNTCENPEVSSPRLRLVGPRMPVNLPLILERIDSGYYDRPEVIDAVAEGVRRDLDGERSAPTRAKKNPEPQTMNPDPIMGGQGRDRDDIHASMMIIVYIVLAAAAWAAAGITALLW